MPVSAYQRERQRLAERLRQLRLAAGISGERLAAQLGWTQSKISKIETLRQLPTSDDIAAWAHATGTPPHVAAELARLLQGARVEYAAWRDTYRSGGPAAVLADIGILEARMTRIAEFQPAMIPGLLQTAEYAREILMLPTGPPGFGASEADIEAGVAARLRRQEVLYQRGSQVHVVLLEGALRSRVVSAEALAGQLDRLIALSGLATLELGIIPFEARVPVFPLSGFRLYDDLVIVESIVGDQQLGDPDDVARYETYLSLLRDSAVTGKEAVAVIQRSTTGLLP